MNSHSIEQAAALIVGADPTGQPLPGAVEWVERRLRRGLFTGYKAARRWRMTDADITAAIDVLRPTRVEEPRIRVVSESSPAFASMTSRSRRKLVAR